MVSIPELQPLAEGNRFQRWYAAWATPYYARMEPEMRLEAAAVDTFLYSRRGTGTWIGMGCATLGTAFGLRGAGAEWWHALLGAVALVVVLGFVVLSAWMFAARTSWRRAAKVFVLGVLGGVSGLFIGAYASLQHRHGGNLSTEDLAHKLGVTMGKGLPIVLSIALALLVLALAVAAVRRGVMQQALEEARLKQERDAAARQAAEAQLKLLRAQIQPHFIFNTLSALQHWVDTADPRAPALLRSLTGFLRSSTDLLGRDDTALADEVAMVQHYLAIMSQRLGERLRFGVEMDAALGAVRLPPGVLLTLVENAVEHGIGPALSGGRVLLQVARDGQQAVITVRDDGAGLAPGWQQGAGANEGVGLANIRERLQHRFGTAAALTVVAGDPQGCVATVRVPAAISESKR
jgi:signal transduction histidine kinase